jgi:hypothetical protein
VSETAKRTDLVLNQTTPEALPAVQSETAAILSMIERLARDPSVDIGRVERMMALHRETKLEKAREDYNVAMAAVQAELPQIKRDAKNDHTRSQYARLETIAAAVDPIITKHGLSLSYGTEDSPLAGHYRVVCTVARGAHERQFHLDTPADGVGSGGKANKTAVQAMGSALSYARRYLKLMIFDIALTNEDNDGNRMDDDRPLRREPERQPEAPKQDRPVITPQQAQELRDAIHDIGETEASFCRHTKIKSVDTILAVDFQAAKDFISKAGRSK